MCFNVKDYVADGISQSKLNKFISHCEYEKIIYHHGNYLRCIYCTQKHMCEMEMWRKVR